MRAQSRRPGTTAIMAGPMCGCPSWTRRPWPGWCAWPGSTWRPSGWSDEEHHPEGHQHEVRGRIGHETVGDLVIAEVDRRVDRTEGHIGPGQGEGGLIHPAGHVVHEPRHVEEYRQLKQVHEVAVGDRHVRRDAG